MRQYRVINGEAQAMRFTRDNTGAIRQWLVDNNFPGDIETRLGAPEESMMILKSEHIGMVLTVRFGDWIVMDKAGWRLCENWSFKEVYEEVEA